MTPQRETYWQGRKLYPWAFLGHHMQGAGVVAGILFGTVEVQILAGGWALYYVAYQGLSIPRKRDSAGLDIKDFMVGAAIAMVAAFVLSVNEARAEGYTERCPAGGVKDDETGAIYDCHPPGWSPSFDDTTPQSEQHGHPFAEEDHGHEDLEHGHPFAEEDHGHEDLEHGHPFAEEDHGHEDLEHDHPYAEDDHGHEELATDDHTHPTVAPEKGEKGDKGDPGKDGAPGQVLHYKPDWAAMAAAAGSIPYTDDPLSIGASAVSIGGANALAIGVSRRFDDWRFSGQVMTSGDEFGATVGAAIGLQ